jgi:hypothetical protein
MIPPGNQVKRFLAVDTHRTTWSSVRVTTPQPVWKGLMKLEMREELTHIVRGGTKRPIATPEEVLALTRT